MFIISMSNANVAEREVNYKKQKTHCHVFSLMMQMTHLVYTVVSKSFFFRSVFGRMFLQFITSNYSDRLTSFPVLGLITVLNTTALD